MPGEWMVIGRIAAPFGVRGEMKIDLLTDFAERFNSLETIFVGAEHAPYRVQQVRSHGDRILLRLAELRSPEAVRELRGAELSVPRSEAAPLPPGHFYLEDAIGLQVRTTEGESVGTVTEVLTTGSNEVFVIGHGAASVLVPVIRDAIADLDMNERCVVVEPWVLTQE
jgi:16S rRNA processing protein RimM